MGMAENGFRQLTNSEHPVHSVEDMKNLKLRVAGSNLLMKCYELWGADATNMNWSETYTALQQEHGRRAGEPASGDRRGERTGSTEICFSLERKL